MAVGGWPFHSYVFALFTVASALLLFTWVGYPLLVRLLAATRSRGAAPRETLDAPMVSVVVATRDADATIVARVQDVLSGSYPADRIEVVVALDARREPPSMLAPLPGAPGMVRVVSGDEPGGKAGALNAAVRQARGSVLVFTDAGQRFAADTIPRLVAALESNQRLAAVSGALITTSAQRGRLSVGDLYWRYERWLRAWEARLHSSVGVTGAVYAMRTALWAPLPAGLILDDLYTPMHAILRGYRVGFDAAALATDDRRFSPEDEYRRKVRTLTGVLQLCVWLPGVLLPWRNPVWVQFVSHKLLRLLTPYLALLGGVSLAVLLAAHLGTSVLLTGSGVLAVAIAAAALGSRKVRDGVWGIALMQAAIVRATVHAARGEWDVWRR